MIKEVDKDTPELISYRLTQVENTNKRIEAKLDTLINGFAPLSEITRLDNKIDTVAKTVQRHEVHSADFILIRKIVYGLVSLVLMSVIGAILALVIIKR